MFSLTCLSLLSGQSVISGARLFAKAVTQSEIYRVLDEKHTIYTIPAFRRDRDGKNYSRFLRKNGAIPGVLYGPDGKGHGEIVLIYIPMSEMDRFITRLNLSFESTLFYLDVEGERTLVFPRQLSCHPSSSFVVKVRYSYRTSGIVEFHSNELCKGYSCSDSNSIL